jgi:hypothetical protein
VETTAGAGGSTMWDLSGGLKCDIEKKLTFFFLLLGLKHYPTEIIKNPKKKNRPSSKYEEAISNNYLGTLSRPCFQLESITFLEISVINIRFRPFVEHFTFNYEFDVFCSGLFVVWLFIDLGKAFDCVNHNLLLSKMLKEGIRADPLSLFRSYLEQ